MKLPEALAFTTLAGALHIAAFSLTTPHGSSAGGGSRGTDTVSVAAISPQMAALVQVWDRPPPMAEMPEIQAPVADNAPDIAQNSPPAPMRALPAQPTAAPPPEPVRADARLPAQPHLRDLMPVLPVITAPPVRGNEQNSVDAAPAPLRVAQPAAPKAPNRQPPPQIDPATPAPNTAAPARSTRPQQRPATLEPAAPAPAQAAQRPRGDGAAGAAKTQSRAPKDNGASAASLRSAQGAWGAQIRQRVAQAQRYPAGTAATGTVKVQITLAPSGRVQGARILTSSGVAALDRAALTAIKRARLPAAPAILRKSNYVFNLPLRFAR